MDAATAALRLATAAATASICSWVSPWIRAAVVEASPWVGTSWAAMVMMEDRVVELVRSTAGACSSLRPVSGGEYSTCNKRQQ